MTTKSVILTKEDYIGYKSRIEVAQKINMMEHGQNILILEWLDKNIARFPKDKKKA